MYGPYRSTSTSNRPGHLRRWDRGAPGNRVGGGVAQPLPRLLRMQGHRRGLTQGLLDGDGDRRGHQRAELGAGGVVSAEQDDGRIEVPCHGDVEADLAQRPPGHPYVEDGVAHRVGQHGGPGTRPSVIADEQDGIRVLVQPGEHAQRAGFAPHQVSTPVEVLRQDVPKRSVRVGDPHNRLGFGVEDPGDHRVRLGRHQRPAALVVVPIRIRLGGMNDPRDALHVDGDQYLHAPGPYAAQPRPRPVPTTPILQFRSSRRVTCPLCRDTKCKIAGRGPTGRGGASGEGWGLGVDVEAQRTGVGEALPHRAYQVPVLRAAFPALRSRPGSPTHW